MTTNLENGLPELWAHQKEGVRRATESKHFAFFWAMGTGKSRSLIEVLRFWFNSQKKITPTLILAPPIVRDNWLEEIKKYSSIPLAKVVILKGSQKKRIADFTYRQKMTDGNMVVVTNYEAMLMQDLYEHMMIWAPKIMVLDESHKCKDRSAKRTKKVLELSQAAEYRYILTGSPILNTMLDLHSQMLFLDRGERLGESWFSFRGRYFYDKNAYMNSHSYFPKWEPQEGAAERIKELLADVSMTIKKEDCLDLPPLIRQTVFVEMGVEQAKAYAEMKRDFLTYVESGVCVANIAITKALRLQQIVSGYVSVLDKEGETQNHRFKDLPRMAALKELLEQLTPENKCVVWSVFKINYAQIRQVCEELEIKYVEVHGEIPDAQKWKAVKSFQEDRSVRVFIGHPGSGGIGISLVAASYMIYYSRGFSLEYELQSEARNYRAGSEVHEKITRIDLLTPGTIDELVLESLVRKQTISESVIGDLKNQI